MRAGAVRGRGQLTLFAVLGACGGSPPATGPSLANTSRGGPTSPHDTDADLVDDATDACPDLGEDWDLRDDRDGCPDPDDDGDGLLDVDDECPDRPAPGTARGCPPRCVIVTSSIDCWNSVVVFFDEHGALVPASRTQLAELKVELADFPEIEALTVIGESRPREPTDAAATRTRTLIDALAAAGIRIPATAGEVWPTDEIRPARAILRIARQRFTERPSKFRTTECSSLGGVHRPARPQTC